jgi:hypothetical protein
VHIHANDPSRRRRSWVIAVALAVAVAMLGAALPVQAAQDRAEGRALQGAGAGKDLWQAVPGKPPAVQGGKRANIRPERFRAFQLNRGALSTLLATAPKDRGQGGQGGEATPNEGLVVSLPSPAGGFARFEVREAPIMEPGLAAKHPDIKTYKGRGLDDPAATIRFDLTPLGFHASVRSPGGAWYIDPYYHRDQSVYVSYFGRDLEDDPHGHFVEHGDEGIAGVEARIGELDMEGLDGLAAASAATTTLRTYRLALLSDSSYATYFGAENVTAAKVTLLNRVNQIYEDETAIRLILIAGNDALNLDTPAQLAGADGPCGTAPCFTTVTLGCSSSTLTRNRLVIGQLVGASSYDVGHIILGRPGGGVATLGSVGGNTKAQGCTGLPNPVGDFFAVDYVAHEIGHQFAANHTFNGNLSNCSGGNRSAANSVEPGSGSSIMAYAGICGNDNLQPHTDAFWSQRSFQEITTFVTSDRPAINEVQTVSLRDFDTDGDAFAVTFEAGTSAPIVRGTNYSAAGIKAAIEGMPGWPAGGTVNIAAWGGGGTLNDNGFQVTFSGTLAQTNVDLLTLTGFAGASGFVGETAKGGPVDNQGHTTTDTGNHAPVVEPVDSHTIPYQTPFKLTGTATDPDGDAVTYMWEQNDRGLTAISLRNANKTSGPLFRQFGTALDMGNYDPLQYYSPGSNSVTPVGTRVFPDLPQILAGNTNAKTGDCTGSAPTLDLVDCYSEFLPTAVYPGPMNFRLTVRDGNPGAGGISSTNTVLSLAAGTGPFLVTSQGTTSTLDGGGALDVTWDVAGTAAAPISATDVRILLSTDGGVSFPHVVAESTPNDGEHEILVPNVATDRARILIEATENVFFAVNDADLAIQAAPVVTNDAPTDGATVQYSDALDPTVTVTATDEDSLGSALSATASGLPAGLSLTAATTSTLGALPGTRTWTVDGNVTDAPGSYPVTVSVTDDTGITRTTSFTILVTPEDARTTYTGTHFASTMAVNSSLAAVTLSATLQDISTTGDAAGDLAPGDIRKATVTFVDRDKVGSPPIPGCQDLPVGLVSANETTTGTATCTWTLNIGNANSLSTTVGTVVGDHYARDATADDTIVTVYRPLVSDFISGGGYLTLQDPAGLMAADPGTKLNFGFGVKFNKKGTNLQGNVNLIVRRTELDGIHTYQIKANALSSLAVRGQTATLNGRASIVDITDPSAPASVDGNATLQLDLSDHGQTGDTLGVTVWDKRGGLWIASRWDGVRTLEQLLDGGGLQVR